MNIARQQLYRLPWSRTDNPGGWIEVTDTCDLACPGCYRSTLEGHAPLERVKSDILELKRSLNCDAIAIAGGEPLLYPHLIEVIEFITEQGLKSRVLTNGLSLTWDLAKELKKAGLANISFHVDSGQNRPGWEGKTEAEMNELRQYYADLIGELGKVHCSFLLTIFRSTLQQVPEVVAWGRKNIHKVRSIALIALRGLPLGEIQYIANGDEVDVSGLRTAFADAHDISITAEEIYEVIEGRFAGSHPSAYLNGTPIAESFKILIIPFLGSKHFVFGKVGAKSVEFSQVFHHLLHGRYGLGARRPDVGKKVFFLSFVDPEVRTAFRGFLKAGLRHPLSLLDRIYTQTIQIQQPKEILDGQSNCCDGCPNQMVYKDKIINSCRLDEYRLYGGPISPLRTRSH